MLDVNEHLQGIIHGHSQIVQLVQAHFIRKDALEEDWKVVSLPVDESAAGRFVDVLLPVGDHIDLPGAVLKALLCLGLQDVLEDQTLAVVDHCLAQKVVPTAKSRGNCCHQILNPCVQWLLEFLLSEVLECECEDIRNLSGDVAVDQDDPLVNQVLLGLEFDLNGFEHFYSLKDVLEAVLMKGGACRLMNHD
jgi:hypothetical protein